MDNFEHEFPRQVQFRLGLSSINALAEPLHRMYPWVFKATIIENSWHHVIRSWLPYLPCPVQRCIRALWPRYALPSTVVLKKLRGLFADRKDIVDKTEEFENEKAMYLRLKSIQGRVIPEFYGEARCDGRRTLVISLLPGMTLRSQTKPRLTVEEYEKRITVPIRELQRFGLIYGDDKLSNIMLVDDRIMFIDLESVEELEEQDRLEWYCTDISIPSFVGVYEQASAPCRQPMGRVFLSRFPLKS